MSTKFRVLALGALSLACVFGNGCVADRPSRNGVFNENQYLRKAFIVRPGDATNPDNGWMLKATVVDASEPNVFGDGMFGVFAGAHNGGELFHFNITSDKLEMKSNREITTDVGTDPNVSHLGETVNAWPITNVDLKYRVNLDGEKTNFYEENQELDWQIRQYVKVNFDKNDVSDIAPLGPFINYNVQNCADMANASATLVPGSFLVDEPHEYMEWSVQVTLPIKWTQDCYEAFGPNGASAARLGRNNETLILKYTMVRNGQMAVSRGGTPTATPTPYTPLIVPEKDAIQKKYGPIYWYTINRDPTTGLLAANQYVVRFDPTKEIKWYFEQGFPAQYLPYFTTNAKVLGKTPALSNITTIEDATNKVLTDSGAAARLSFHLYNEPLDDGTPVNRVFGDVRFNMLRWVQSVDQQSQFAGATAFTIDPRTGEALNSDIVFENFQIHDYYSARIDAYLQSIGASTDSPFNPTDWTDPVDAMGNTISCSASNVGQAAPLIPKIAVAAHNGGSTLYQKMQSYLYKPVGQYGPLGPQDFILGHTDDNNDFYNAYFAVLPYLVYGDPAANPFVTSKGGSGTLGVGTAAQTLWGMIDKEAQFHQLQAD